MSDRYIPKELVIRIFHKLPLKSLFKCTTVCKLWHSLIHSPQFISAHFQNPNQELLLLRFHINNADNLSLYFPDNRNLDEYTSITQSLPVFQSSHIVGSCKGLLCVFLGVSLMFSLWNPILGKSQFLPKSKFPADMGISNVFGLGCSDEYDYKILHLSIVIRPNQERRIYAEIYSLKENSWKDITSTQIRNFLIPNRAVPAFVNGALHWVASGSIRNFIIAFDMTNEVFSQMELPRPLMHVKIRGLSVFPFGDSSIAVTSRTSDGVYTDIWVKKEYNVGGSWVKLPAVGEYARGRSSVLWIKDCDNVLMEFSGGNGHIGWFNLEKRRVTTLVENVKCVRCFPFVESLGLLKEFPQLVAAPAE